MEEFKALVELLGMLVWHPGTGVLMALLLVAAVIDVRTMRIPNWLTVGGMVWGLAFNATHSTSITAGLLNATLGLCVGLALLLPMYLLRVMGAGDVKLMAMAGSFIGFPNIVPAVIFVFICGGIAALAFALHRRAFRRMTNNVTGIVQSMAFAALSGMRPTAGMQSASIGKLPYGVSIAVGTTAWLAASVLGLA
jgi:prepilin peptidase CpaA